LSRGSGNLGTAARNGENNLAVALDYVEDREWNDPDYLDSMRRRSQKLTLAAAASEQVAAER
jgi:hypothetical protein